jgi:hypothetical protein
MQCHGGIHSKCGCGKFCPNLHGQSFQHAKCIKHLEGALYPTLYFQGCVTICFDLLLEDWGKEPWVKRLVTHAKTIISFIWMHHMPFGIYRWYKSTFNLSHHVKTRFATNFIMVDKLVNVWRLLRRQL